KSTSSRVNKNIPELHRLPASAISSSTVRPTEKSAIQSSTDASKSLSTYDLIFSAVGLELLQYPRNTSRRSCKSARHIRKVCWKSGDSSQLLSAPSGKRQINCPKLYSNTPL